MILDIILLLVVVVAGALKFYHYSILSRRDEEDKAVKQSTRTDLMIIKYIEFINIFFTISLLFLLIRTLFLHGYIEIDLSLVLVVLLFVTGIIYFLDVVFLRKFLGNDKDREETDSPASKAKIDWKLDTLNSIIDVSRFLFPVILIVLVVRSFIVEPFRIPSASMYPTLEIGDFILVNRYAYGLRLPVLHTKILEVGDPQRGDVAVFRFPGNPSIDYIKRIVGVPGDRIMYHNQQLYVNGEPVKYKPIGEYSKLKYAVQISRTNFYWKDHMEYSGELGGVKHSIILRDRNHRSSLEQPEIVVPEGHYFALGDNRDGSSDSRAWGLVADKYLKGRAFFIWLSYDEADQDHDGEKDGMKWSRIGTVIK